MGDLEVCAGAWRSGREQSATMGGGSLSFQSDPTRWRLVRTVTSGVVRSPSALEQAAGELLKPGVGYLAVVLGPAVPDGGSLPPWERILKVSARSVKVAPSVVGY